MNTVQQIFALIAAHQWVPLAALVVGFTVRLLKSDTAFPITIPPTARSWAALILGAVGGVLTSMVGGMPMQQAVISGVSAALLAIAGHVSIIEVARGGREISLPKFMLLQPVKA